VLGGVAVYVEFVVFMVFVELELVLLVDVVLVLFPRGPVEGGGPPVPPPPLLLVVETAAIGISS
jgi:hypothetical protein